jgi:hypothetical protein
LTTIKRGIALKTSDVEPTQELIRMLHAARDARCRHIQVSTGLKQTRVQFSHEDWTFAYAAWDNTLGGPVIDALLENITPKLPDAPYESHEAIFDYPLDEERVMSARLSLVVIDPERYEVILKFF